MPYDEVQDAARREEPREDADREAGPDRGGAPVRDDEHDGGFGDGPLM